VDNRNLSLKELVTLRIKAVESVVLHGLTQTKACKVFGFSPASMCKYVKEYKVNKSESFQYKKRGVKLGERSKMHLTQQEELVATILSKTPDELGLNYTLWNSTVVNEYLSSKYSLNYNRRSIRKIMAKLGFSAQKPIKLAYQRDPKKRAMAYGDLPQD